MKTRRRHDTEDLQFLLFCLLIFVFLVIMNSQDFRIHHVDVVGGDPAISRQLASLKLLNTPILFVPYRALKRSLLKSNPEFEDLQFQLSNPGAWTLSLAPEPRIPALFLKRGRQAWYVDERGILFPVHGKAQNLPQIEFQASLPLMSGMPIPFPYRDIILKLTTSISTMNAPAFSRLILDSKGNCTFFTKEGVWVQAGPWQGLTERLRLLQPILRTVRERKIPVSGIDLRHEKTPVLKLK